MGFSGFPKLSFSSREEADDWDTAIDAGVAFGTLIDWMR
jgi:hypothetical protein